MLRILLVALILGVLFAGIHYIRRQPADVQKKLWPKAILYGAGLLLLVMAITGKIHWIGALIAGLIPVVSRAGHLLIGYAPSILQRWRQSKHEHQEKEDPHQPPATSSANMEITEALEVLGLAPNPGKSEIIQAHRKMMQQFHPDRGGNDYFASKLNAAKALLLKSARKE